MKGCETNLYSLLWQRWLFMGMEERGSERTHTMLTLNKAGPVTTEGGACSVLGTGGYGQRTHTHGFEQETWINSVSVYCVHVLHERQTNRPITHGQSQTLREKESQREEGEMLPLFLALSFWPWGGRGSSCSGSEPLQHVVTDSAFSTRGSKPKAQLHSALDGIWEWDGPVLLQVTYLLEWLFK